MGDIANNPHPHAFAWVDGYFAQVRPHFSVRREDQLLIVMPNRAVRLNASGLAILSHLREGGTIAALLERIGPEPQRRQDLHYFLLDFRSLISGCLGDGQNRKAVQTEPYRNSINALPVLSEIALTYRCNLRCKFCYASCGCTKEGDSSYHNGPAKDGAGPAPVADLVKLLDTVGHQAKVPSISFTGGEPLLHPQLDELVAAAVKVGLRVNLITNGTLIDQNRAVRLKNAGLCSAQVSLEGPSAQVHDGLTGVAGSFDLTLAGLTALRAAGIHTHTNTTINAANAAHMLALVDMLADMGMARMSANMVIPCGSAADRSIQIRYSDIGPIVLAVRSHARQRGVEFMWYSPTPMCLFNPLAEGLGNKSCAACDGLLSISPSGDVLPCSSYPQPVGNLLRQSFSEVWNCAQATFLRRKGEAPASCNGCEDFAACSGACPLYWSAMGVDELPDRRMVR